MKKSNYKPYRNGFTTEKAPRGITIPLRRKNSLPDIVTANNKAQNDDIQAGNIATAHRPIYGGYKGIALWPDGEIRRNDPLPYLTADREVTAILKTLIRLNRTGVYSSFFTYWANTGQLEIAIYPGLWNHTKEPARKITLDCRRYPLFDLETEKEISADDLEQQLILLTQ